MPSSFVFLARLRRVTPRWIESDQLLPSCLAFTMNRFLFVAVVLLLFMFLKDQFFFPKFHRFFFVFTLPNAASGEERRGGARREKK